jgi:cytochrome c553
MKSLLIRLSLISFLFILIVSCEKEGGNESSVSSNNSSRSHKTGENCMNCHKSGGEGEGWFKVAGSVYGSDFQSIAANGTVNLYTGPGGTGTLIASIDVDNLGNFYTTQSVSFSGGVYPSVQNNAGTEYFMSELITTGACSSCHGKTADRIYVE